MINCRNIVVAFIFLFPGLVQAQKRLFYHLTVEQGLSQNTVLSIAQDNRGYIWLGTRHGLNRYDGHRLVNYNYNNNDSGSISDDYINTLLCDSKHVLWVGTEKGLNRFDAEQNVFKHISLPGTTKPSDNVISALLEEPGGTVWAGTTGHLYTKQPGQDFFKELSTTSARYPFAGSSIKKIFFDSEGYCWVATTQGLSRLKKEANGYAEKKFTSDPSVLSSISDNYVTAVTQDQHGNLWIGTINGLNLYNRQTENFTRFYTGTGMNLVNNNIRTLLPDRSGTLWIGTQEGLSLMNPVTKTCTSYQNDAADEKSLSQNSVHSLFEDANGTVWIGTFFGGVNMVHTYTTGFSVWRNNPSPSSISNNVVSSVVADDNNNLWIGTEGGGLNYLNRSTGNVTRYKYDQSVKESLGSNLVKTVFIDRDKNLWVGTHGGGLNLYNSSTGRFNQFFIDEDENKRKQTEVVALLEDKENHFWVGKHPGVYVFVRQNTSLVPSNLNDALSALKNKSISCLLEDRTHRIWIGTLSGLYRFSLVQNKLETVNLPASTGPVPNINCMMEDGSGNIWLGLYYGGLVKIDGQSANTTHYTSRNGLPHNNVLGILEDKQHLWLSTSNGLVQFNVATGQFHTYTASDGLAGNEFNYNAFYQSKSGEMFFGGTNGLTGFYPGSIETNHYSAPLVFTGLKIFNDNVAINDKSGLLKKDIGFVDHLVFGYNQHTFTIEFALLNYIRSAKNRYAYKLEGAGNEWTEITEPSATFTNLAEGEYVLWIKGSNNDGIWGKPARMQISILPPFWKSGLAYLLYLCITGVFLFFIIRYFYIRALLRRDQELHQVKLNFFTNVSHEIRTHLSLIMTPVEQLQKEHRHNSVLSHQLGNIRNNAERLLKLVSELMDFRKAETNKLQLHIGQYDFIAFINSIYGSFEELSLTKNISLSLVHDVPSLPLYFDKEQLEKVVFNLISNAFKFTPEGGRIQVCIESTGKQVNLHVIDNGRGIAPEYIDKLFTNFFQINDHSTQNTGYGIGLALSKTIAQLHQGTLTVESKAGSASTENRTCFTLSLQKGSDHFSDDQLVHPLSVIKEPVSQLALPEEPVATGTEKKQYSILVTEDNDELRQLIVQSLQANYRVLEAEHGLTGWQIAAEEIPDLVISDVMMPELDGFAFCQRLKQDERTSHIPVILLTAKTSQTDHVSGLTTGADLYLTKPFSTQVLELSIRNLLAAREIMAQKFSKQFLLQPQNVAVNNQEEQFLTRLIEIIEDNLENPEFGVEMLAQKATMSQTVLYKKLKALVNMPVNDFIKSIRLKRAAQLLELNQYSIYEVGYMVGFNDRKYFSKEFKKQFGKTPSEFMQKE